MSAVGTHGFITEFFLQIHEENKDMTIGIIQTLQYYLNSLFVSGPLSISERVQLLN